MQTCTLETCKLNQGYFKKLKTMPGRITRQRPRKGFYSFLNHV